MNNKWVVILVSAVVFVAVWNLVDYLLSTFLFGDGYQFKIIGDVVVPLVASGAVDYFLLSRKSE